MPRAASEPATSSGCPLAGTGAKQHYEWNRPGSTDRLEKYGWGTLRLALLLAAALLLAPRLSAQPAAAAAATAAYLHSWSWAGHAAVGAVGALVNAGALGGLAANLAALAGAVGICLLDVSRGCGLATFVYLAKTAGGDLLAGKLDQREWWASIAAFLVLLYPALAAARANADVLGPLVTQLLAPAAEGGFARILALLLALQAACELGDARLERWAFFRHRWSFEAGTAALLCALRLHPQELAVVQIDLVACLAYRAVGFLAAAAASPATTRALFAALFRIYFWRRGVRMVVIKDPLVARAVLASSEVKVGVLSFSY